MTRRQTTTAILAIMLIPLLRAVPALAAGDKVIPHVVDGVQDATTRYRTKLDIMNLSPHPGTTITRVTVYFFNSNGTPWPITLKDPVTKLPTTVNSYTLNLGYAQTLRLETLGTGALNAGYAIVRNLEVPVAQSDPDFHPEYWPDSREVSTTVYFEVLRGNDIMDTVSVPVAQPSISFLFPVEIDLANGINTGFAIVNLTDAANNVTLYLSENTDPSQSGDAIDAGNTTVRLDAGANKKKVDFLSNLFAGKTKFKGMVYGASEGPVATLSLVQSNSYFNGAWSGVQFATVTPAYLDSLRRNTLMYMVPGTALDADLPGVDYFPTPMTNGVPDSYYSLAWDVVLSATGTSRQLVPQPGTLIARLGIKSGTDFDNITLPNLDPTVVNFSTNAINLSDQSGDFTQGFCFAIKTNLGKYVKVRIRTVVTYDTGSADSEMALEIFVYK